MDSVIMNFKHKMKTLKYLIVLSLVSLSYGTHAEDKHNFTPDSDTSDSLSLHEVVEKTWLRNPQRDVLSARLQHVDARQKTADSFWANDPVFNVNHYNDKLMDNDGLQEWEVGVELPLWMPGQKQAQYKTIENTRLELDASEPVLKLEIAGLVREMLWAIAFAKNRLEFTEKEWDVVKKLESNVQKRLELGDLSQSDHILAQQESLSKEAAYNLAFQEYKHAHHRYEMITGLNQLPADFTETATNDYKITTEHPLLYAASKKVDVSTAEYELSKKQKRGNPILFIGTRHERGISNDSFTNAIGMSFSVPFGLSSHSQQKVTATAVTLSENKSNMELLYRQLNIAIQDTSKELIATEQQLEFAEKQTELSNKNLKLIRKAFDLGETSLIELIRIQARAFAVERNLFQKQLEVGLLSARLNQAKGIIP